MGLTPAWRALLEGLAAGPACVVEVESTEGSVPRGRGAWMAVFPGGALVGTIGGGRLEWDAHREALRRLAGGEGPAVARFALGPSLGQCCGGVVHLRFTLAGPQDREALARRLAPALAPVALFGAGHVGHALARVLAPLPFALTWIDSRDSVFPQEAGAQARCEHSEPVQAAVPGLAPGSRVLVMSFSHAEDLDVVAACLARQRARADLPFIGLIGSRTKWATFSHRLEARGFSRDELRQVTCPIGMPGIAGKEPEVIAVSVAAQLLATLAPPDPA
ncbi:xanthine dehydrogenase accessory factor [Paracidovorax anthurii]|uniref:Xanthine dehydrogenase accessory factor n=1 Tax=Paracidovorax anthurii TaxID=78229 RepID=A0A328ZEU2_9BURK|nr:xanthine dehydrogenase accessory protein XdhC [Paracidovorax anthurii]RAR84830.1 xanthine dehydrogenase accessory factor [Paracidovorax anthurii]